MLLAGFSRLVLPWDLLLCVCVWAISSCARSFSIVALRILTSHSTHQWFSPRNYTFSIFFLFFFSTFSTETAFISPRFTNNAFSISDKNSAVFEWCSKTSPCTLNPWEYEQWDFEISKNCLKSMFPEDEKEDTQWLPRTLQECEGSFQPADEHLPANWLQLSLCHVV